MCGMEWEGCGSGSTAGRRVLGEMDECRRNFDGRTLFGWWEWQELYGRHGRCTGVCWRNRLLETVGEGEVLLVRVDATLTTCSPSSQLDDERT
jgi:hypothetical protein